MSIPYNNIDVCIDVSNIVHNYKQLDHVGGNAIPVIKSDAYGHGLIETARALDNVGAATFAVGTVGEAALLREAGFSGRIIALLGPQSRSDFNLLCERNILPFISRLEQLELLHETISARSASMPAAPAPVALKFDTGMARLGFTPEELPSLLSWLEEHDSIHVVMASSHLATADDPEQKNFVKEQARIFGGVASALRFSNVGGALLETNIANSAALLAYPDLRLDSQRPGIALYGANPFHGTAWEEKGRGLLPAMNVTAPVLQVRTLKKGQSISYGRTFHAPRDMRVAIVGVGYADCYTRGLSTREGASGSGGWMQLHGKRAPIMGRVCMQMTAVDVTDIPETRAGDRVLILGGSGANAITPEELAGWWGTIPYEVFCLLGLNKRRYLD